LQANAHGDFGQTFKFYRIDDGSIIVMCHGAANLVFDRIIGSVSEGIISPLFLLLLRYIDEAVEFFIQ